MFNFEPYWTNLEHLRFRIDTLKIFIMVACFGQLRQHAMSQSGNYSWMDNLFSDLRLSVHKDHERSSDTLKVFIITWRFWLRFQHAKDQSVWCIDTSASLDGLEQKLEIQMRRSDQYDRQEDYLCTIAASKMDNRLHLSKQKQTYEQDGHSYD